MKKHYKLTIAVVLLVAVVAAIAYCAANYSFSARDLYEWYKEHMTYAVIALLMGIESSIVPLPSEVVVPPAAYFSLQAHSQLEIFMVMVTATVGAYVGSVVNYVLSMIIGRPLIYAFADSKVGHMFMLNSDKLRHAEDYFQRKGSVAIFLGRLLPAVRHLISIPAGMSKMNFLKFSVYTILGAGVWNAVLSGFGYMLYLVVPNDAQLFDALEHYNEYLKAAGYGLILLIVVYLVVRHYKKKRSKKLAAREENTESQH